MITSLQNFFLKHNKWLFGGLLVVIIVTFVLTIGPQSFFGSQGDTQRRALKYYGYDLSSESDQRTMAFSAEVSAILHPELGLRREQLMDYAYLRAAGLGMAAQLGVPQPTKEELTAYISTLLIFADQQTGEFSAESYNRMMDALQSNARFDRESIGTVLREDYRIQQVRNALGGPDYSLPFETRQDYITRQTTYQVDTANLAYDSFEPEIEVAEEALLQFFNENPTRYEIGETISATALLFKAGSYLAEVVEPTEADLEAYFSTNRARYEASREQPAEGEPALAELTLTEVYTQVLQDWKRQQATRIAAKKGEQFSLRLWQEGVALDSPEFNSLLLEFGAQTLDIPPYARDQAPRIANVPVQVLNSMWIYANNPTRYFSDIAQIADGAVVVVNRGVTEARMPELAEVRDQVVADFTISEKRRLFSEKGSELYDIFTTRLETESFSEVAESLGLTVEKLEVFDGTTVPQELRASTVWDQTMYLDQGELTRMVIQNDKGTFAYVAEKTVPALDETSEDFKTFVEQRSTGLSDAMGWARLREITDTSLSALLGSPTGIE